MDAVTRTDLLLVEGFLSPDESAALAAKPMRPHPRRHDANALKVYGADVVTPIVHRVSDALRAHFAIDGDLFCEYAAACQSLVGMGHVEHADNERPDGSPNHTRWRLVTAMLYLNTCGVDFDGGQIEFTRLGQTVEPRAGLLVGFRCDGIHTHRVPAVTRGERRALAFWFTADEKYRGRVASVG